MNNQVYRVACGDYEAALAPALDRMLEMAGWLADSAIAGQRVLVKPNLLTDRAPEQAVTTHPALVRLVVRRLKAAGARVTVGDSPASAANLACVWERSGIGAVCAEEGVPLIALEQAGAETFTLDGFTFPIARPVLEADRIVNLPKVKSHSLTLLTAAVKNIYGTIPGYAKTTLHRQYPKPEVFGRLVRTLWRVMPPCWTLADAVVGMEGQGPANGRPVPLGFLAAAEDPLQWTVSCARCCTSIRAASPIWTPARKFRSRSATRSPSPRSMCRRGPTCCGCCRTGWSGVPDASFGCGPPFRRRRVSAAACA